MYVLELVNLYVAVRDLYVLKHQPKCVELGTSMLFLSVESKGMQESRVSKCRTHVHNCSKCVAQVAFIFIYIHCSNTYHSFACHVLVLYYFLRLKNQPYFKLQWLYVYSCSWCVCEQLVVVSIIFLSWQINVQYNMHKVLE